MGRDLRQQAVELAALRLVLAALDLGLDGDGVRQRAGDHAGEGKEGDEDGLHVGRLGWAGAGSDSENCAKRTGDREDLRTGMLIDLS